VRDAFLTAASLDERKLAEHEPMEHKTEVIIGRASGKGEHPRTGERVPAGTSFRAHIVVHLFDADLPDRAAAFKATLANALKVLEDSESIGASGSRGYGEIKLGPVTWREVEVNSLRIAFDETT
jgi:CRISPR-associated protein Csm3